LCALLNAVDCTTAWLLEPLLNVYGCDFVPGGGARQQEGLTTKSIRRTRLKPEPQGASSMLRASWAWPLQCQRRCRIQCGCKSLGLRRRDRNKFDNRCLRDAVYLQDSLASGGVAECGPAATDLRLSGTCFDECCQLQDTCFAYCCSRQV